MRYRNRGIYRTAGIACFFQDTEKYRNRILCVIYSFLQNIAKYHKYITDITDIETGKELYTK